MKYPVVGVAMTHILICIQCDLLIKRSSPSGSTPHPARIIGFWNSLVSEVSVLPQGF